METDFNFKSSVCTSREQSERLLALGLKKETADMVYSYVREEHEDNYYWELDILESSWDSYIWPSNHTFVPAWSLGRLIEIACNGQTLKGDICSDIIFDEVIDCIEHEIKEGYFNKEYLV